MLANKKHNFTFMSNLVRRPDYRRAYLFFKRYLLEEVQKLYLDYKKRSDYYERLDNLLNSDIEKELKAPIRVDLSIQKAELRDIKTKLAFYGLANQLSYEEYIVNILFYNSWMMEKVIYEGFESYLSWKGVPYFRLYGKVYVPRAKLDEQGNPKLLVSRGKTWKNYERLKREGKINDLYSATNPDGEKYFEYIDKPTPFLEVVYCGKSNENFKNYNTSLIKFGLASETICNKELNALTQFYYANQNNSDLALNYHKHECKS